MKILYYSSLPLSDADFPLVRAMTRSGAEVRYVIPLLPDHPTGPLGTLTPKKCSALVPAREYEPLRAYENYLSLDNVYVLNRTVRGARPRNILLYLKFVWKILRFRPDVIQITWPLSGPELPLYLLRRKLVLTVHDPFPHSSDENPRNTRQRALAFRLCPRFVLLNSRQAPSFREYYNIRKPVLTTSLSAYDVLSHGFPADRSDDGYILFFGRITPYKGLDVLLKAVPLVREVLPGQQFIVAGKGTVEGPLPEGVTLVNEYIDSGRRADLLSHCSAVVCPYRDATQSGVVFTAFAFGKPVIASDVGALSEAVEDGVTGLLVPPLDPAALAEAIVRLRREEGLVEKLSSRVSELYANGGSWDEIAAAYLAFYASE